MGYRLGIDTGGTFTDFVLIREDGTWDLIKAASTPGHPVKAIEAGLALVCKQVGLALEAFLARCDMIIYGSTVGLNALIQHKGAKVGLLTTRGHQDALEIRLAHKEDGHRYDFEYPPAPALVPRRLRIPVRERLNAAGAVLKPLVEEDVIAAVEQFKAADVSSVAVCFLWSFLNDAHERRAGEIVRELMPDAYLTLSVDVLPQIREYTRVSTTAVNAFIGPVLLRSINEIEGMLRLKGFRNPIRYMQNNGGIASGSFISRKGVYALSSGPAAGPTASHFFGSRAGFDNLLTLDMGGTSTDISIIQNGSVDIIKNVEVERYMLGIPQVNVVCIGAGGGSIAWQDSNGILRVGPQSAEAVPGPACYGKGGQEATVTDALSVLGYINPDYLLGGTFQLQPEAATEVIARKVANPLSLSMEEAALGVFRIVNSNMVGGIRAVSVERGYDPRDCVFVAGGGATSAFIGRLAEELDVERVLIPKVASGLCAFGAAISDVKHSHVATYISKLSKLDLTRMNGVMTDLEERGRKDLTEEGFEPGQIEIRRTLEMRYGDQIHECVVPVPMTGALSAADLDVIRDMFHKRHEEIYTYCEPENEPELVNLEVTAIGLTRAALRACRQREERAPASGGAVTRKAYFEEFGKYVDTPVYDGRQVEPGRVIAGPAIIEEPTTTIVVFPKWRIELQPSSCYFMTR
jgi:N-methylhydantoinase A